MKEVIVKAWCDACWLDGEQRTPSAHTYTTGMVGGESSRPQLKVIELCDMHDKIATDFMALLSEVAAVPDFNKPAAPKAAPPPVKYNSGKRVDCPVCHEEFTTGGLVGHIWSLHRPGETRPVMGTVCPDCRAEYDTGQGLGQHRKAEHGWNAIADALSGVKGYRAK